MDLPTQPPEPPLPRWATREEAAAHLGVHITTLIRMVNRGELTRYTVGGVSRYNLNDIDALFLANADTGGRP